jgi:hypothetical protein
VQCRLLLSNINVINQFWLKKLGVNPPFNDTTRSESYQAISRKEQAFPFLITYRIPIKISYTLLQKEQRNEKMSFGVRTLGFSELSP